MARGRARIDSSLPTAKTCSNGRVDVDRTRSVQSLGRGKTFSHGLGQQRRFRHVRCHVRCHVRYFQYRTSIDMVPQCLAIGRGLRSQHTAHNAPAGSDVDSLHSTVGRSTGLVVSARTRLPPLQGTRKAPERAPIEQNDNPATPVAA